MPAVSSEECLACGRILHSWTATVLAARRKTAVKKVSAACAAAVTRTCVGVQFRSRGTKKVQEGYDPNVRIDDDSSFRKVISSTLICFFYKYCPGVRGVTSRYPTSLSAVNPGFPTRGDFAEWLCIVHALSTVTWRIQFWLYGTFILIKKRLFSGEVQIGCGFERSEPCRRTSFSLFEYYTCDMRHFRWYLSRSAFLTKVHSYIVPIGGCTILSIFECLHHFQWNLMGFSGRSPMPDTDCFSPITLVWLDFCQSGFEFQKQFSARVLKS